MLDRPVEPVRRGRWSCCARSISQTFLSDAENSRFQRRRQTVEIDVVQPFDIQARLGPGRLDQVLDGRNHAEIFEDDGTQPTDEPAVSAMAS